MTDDFDQPERPDRPSSTPDDRSASGTRSDEQSADGVRSGERSSDEPRSDAGLDRRGLLRSVAGGAYVLGLAQALDAESFLSPPEGAVSVETALVRRDPAEPESLEPRTRKVPADWHAAVTRAFDIHERLSRTTVPGFVGSAVVPGSHDSASATISVRVDVSDLRQARDRLRSVLGRVIENPARVLDGEYGVDVSLDGVDGVRALEADPVDLREPNLVDDRVGLGDRVPGGVHCETEASSATLAPAVYHPSRERPWFATAAHAFTGTDAPSGEALYLPRRNGDPIVLGDVVTAHRIEDLALIDPSGHPLPGPSLQGASRERVVGQYTRIGLADLAARGVSLEKVGARTMRTAGRIDGIDAITCLTDQVCRDRQLTWGEETDMTDGDSGSVSYNPDPDLADEGVLVASLNNARTWWPGQNFMWGVAAYALTSRHGLHF